MTSTSAVAPSVLVNALRSNIQRYIDGTIRIIALSRHTGYQLEHRASPWFHRESWVRFRQVEKIYIISWDVDLDLGRGCGCEQQDQWHDMTKYEYLFCPLAVLSLSRWPWRANTAFGAVVCASSRVFQSLLTRHTQWLNEERESTLRAENPSKPFRIKEAHFLVFIG